MKLNIEKGSEFTKDFATAVMVGSVDFWNKNGKEIYEDNKRGDNLGNTETNEYARKTKYDDWLNEMIYIDCKGICKGKEYNCGRTRSHVWVHNGNNERVLMIYAK